MALFGFRLAGRLVSWIPTLTEQKPIEVQGSAISLQSMPFEVNTITDYKPLLK